MSTKEFTNTINGIMEQKGTPTLKAIAGVFDLPPVRLYNVAKQPKEGEVYDARVYNWDAIERFIARRLDQEGTPDTIEEVIDAALVIDEELKAADGRRRENGGSNNKKIEVDGKMIPERKFSNHAMLDEDGNPTGNLVVLKKDPCVYKIVLQTLSHTVLVPVDDAQGTVTSNDVKVISNGMLNHRGMGVTATAEGIESRFSGEYLEKHPEYAPGYQAPVEE